MGRSVRLLFCQSISDEYRQGKVIGVRAGGGVTDLLCVANGVVDASVLRML